MTDQNKPARKPRSAPKTFQQKLEAALDIEEEKLKALTAKLHAAEDAARALRLRHAALTAEINRGCKSVGRKDLSERERDMAVTL